MLRFSCEKALLQSAVNTTSRAVAAKSSIPALEGILLEGGDTLTLSGYNMQTGIRTIVDAQVQSPGRIVLSARLFGEMIRKMPDDVIVFAADENLSVHLTCGDASFEILGLSADDYPELPEVDDQFSVDIRQGTLKAMINQTSFAVSTNESRPVHTGSLFEVGDQDLTVVSVDGFRLALRREPLDRAEGGAFKFVAPGSALNEVEKICEDSDEKVTIIQGKRHLLFEAGATQLICRRLEGDFLDYKNAIPRNNPIRLTVDTKPCWGAWTGSAWSSAKSSRARCAACLKMAGCCCPPKPAPARLRTSAPWTATETAWRSASTTAISWTPCAMPRRTP